MRELIVVLIYLDFIILLAACTAILLPLYKLRKNILPRAIGALLILIATTAVAILISIYTGTYTTEDAAQLAVTSVVYILMFTAVFGAVALCFKGSMLSILLCCITGYAIKEFAEDIFNLLSFIPSFPNFLDMTAENFVNVLLEYYAIQLAVYAVICTGIYFFMLRRNYHRITSGETKLPILLSALFTILICSTFNLIRNTFAQGNTVLNVLCIIYDLICCLLIILLRLGVFEKDEYEQEVITMQSLWKEKQTQLELFRNTIDEINVKYHDMKRNIALLRVHGENGESFLNELETSLQNYDTNINTGNTTLDTMLTQYRLQYKNSNINFTCIADGKLLSFLTATDMVAMIGNILENAIEAVNKLPQDKRSISFSVTETMGLIRIYEENPFNDEICLKNGLPLTSKSDNKYHGFGMKSIQMILNKYGGTMSIDISEKIFRLNILLKHNN